MSLSDNDTILLKLTHNGRETNVSLIIMTNIIYTIIILI